MHSGEHGEVIFIALSSDLALLMFSFMPSKEGMKGKMHHFGPGGHVGCISPTNPSFTLALRIVAWYGVQIR